MEWFDLLVLVARSFDELGVRYFVTGSGATITYGEPRYTNDIDVVADLKAADIDGLCQAFPAPDFYLSAPAVAEAIRLRRMFNIIHPASGLKVDVSIPQEHGFDQLRLSRVVTLRSPSGQDVCFSSPEDVILKKMEFFREGGSEKHLRDITGVLKICPHPIDRSYIEDWAAKLEVLDVWNMIIERLDETAEQPGEQADNEQDGP